MYEIMKAIAAVQSWVFEYGRADFQNLYEASVAKDIIHLFLDPVEIRDIDNDSGVTEKKAYSGSFMVLLSSDIDEKSYDDRYQDYIKPIIQNKMNLIKESLVCDSEATVKMWKTTEVINMFDFNFDGVICTYEIIVDAE